MKRIAALLFLTLALCSLVAVIGCAGVQQGIDHANDYLDRPATTQPGSPTNGQNIQAGAGVASTVAPWAGVATTAVLFLLHNLDSRRRTAKVIDAVGESSTGPAK